VHDVGGVGGVLAWLLNTAVSAIVGLGIGAAVVGIVSMLPARSEDAVHEAH